MKTSLRLIIFISAVWALALYWENIFTHAYYRGLTLTPEIRKKLTKDEINGIAERTEAFFRNTFISYLAPLSIALIAACGLWCALEADKGRPH
jgi:hypothetical protein